MKSTLDTSGLREDYLVSHLDERDAPADPMTLFAAWLEQALAAGLPEPYAMTLATATQAGVPSARMVLLRAADERGFSFYTNYASRKGAELEANPQAGLLFYWAPLERQVRIEGRIEKLPEAESDAYFATRPYANRVGAWASHQSQVIPDRETLEARVAELTQQFGDQVPRPPHWGGYRLVAASIEFWQGRASRLHDRLQYLRDGAAAWRMQRLSP